MQEFIKSLMSGTSSAIVSLSTLILAVAAIVKYGKGSYKYLSNQFKSMLIKMLDLKQLSEKHDKLESKIDRILNELTPNGGKSTKDLICQVQDSIVRMELKQQAMFNSREVTQGLFECDAYGHIIWTNRQFCYLLNKTPQDLFGLNWINSVIRDEREGIAELWENCIRERRDFDADVEMYVGHNNETAVFSISTQRMVKDNHNEIIGWFGTIVKHS